MVFIYMIKRRRMGLSLHFELLSSRTTISFTLFSWNAVNMLMSSLIIQINKNLFIKFQSEEVTAFWETTIASTEKQLLESLLIGISEKMVDFEIMFMFSKIEEHKRIALMIF